MNTPLERLVLKYDQTSHARRQLKSTRPIARIFASLDRVDTRIRDLRKRICEESDSLNAARKVSSRRRSASLRLKTSSGRRAEASYANSAAGKRSSAAQLSLKTLQTRLQAAKVERRELEKDLQTHPEWRTASQEYYAARHALLHAVSLLDISSPRLERKARYLAVAGLDIDPQEVWSDATSEQPREVNLFYGGDGAPDGIGHGHAILKHVHDGEYVLAWHRLAEPQDEESTVG